LYLAIRSITSLAAYMPLIRKIFVVIGIFWGVYTVLRAINSISSWYIRDELKSKAQSTSVVIIRKISKGSRSRRGANAFAILLSIIQTLRFQKMI